VSILSRGPARPVVGENQSVITGSVPSDIYVESDGLRLRCRDWGGNGRAVVLLHGLASNARIWDFVAPRLAGSARVVAVDQRGHGQSDRPEHGYTFDLVTEDFCRVLDALHIESVVVVGHSWGANVAVAFAAARPALPSGIALVDGGIFDLSTTPGMTWEQAERTMAPPRLAGTPRGKFFDMIRSGPLAELWSDELEAIVMAQFDAFPDGTISPRLSYERHMEIVRAIWEYHPAKLLRKVRCPVLLLPCVREPFGEWFERKRVAVAEVERTTPHARTVWLTDAIHDVPLQQPERLAGIIASFVREIDDAESE
jgi:pimeloyl-ACP methyl ester carboxylesterase